jgi:PAS domain-containing protein
MAAPATFHEEVAERFGVLPNFFCSAKAAPGLIEQLWGFAKSAYLDNPLPSLFKERLFVHLSRFSVARYCIVRHAGFLIGHGRPAGDASVRPEPVDDVIALLRRPVPDAEPLDTILDRLCARTVAEPIPAPRTEFEHDLFDVLTVLFLTPFASGRAHEAVRTAVGETNLEYLLAFMAFIRAAHYWTETHSDLAYEADMLALIERLPELGELLLDPAEAEQTRGGLERTRALATMRESEERFQAVVGTLQHDLKVQEEEVGDLARYRLLIDAVTDYAIYMLDPNGRIASWNSGARRLKGYEPTSPGFVARLDLILRPYEVSPQPNSIAIASVRSQLPAYLPRVQNPPLFRDQVAALPSSFCRICPSSGPAAKRPLSLQANSVSRPLLALYRARWRTRLARCPLPFRRCARDAGLLFHR